MPTDPRMTAASSQPNAAPVSSAALNNVFVALVDLSRRIDSLEAARTVIADDTITSSHIATGSIHAAEIEVGNIVASIMTVGAINASHMAANSITVGNAAIQDATITTAKIADLAVTTAKINDLAVTTAKIGNLAVDSAQIANLAVTNGKIANATINVAKIDTASISDLSTLSSNTGTLTASLIKTANSPNARIEIGTTAGGIKAYNSSNALTFGFDVTTGAATVGSITVTGAAGTSVPASTLTGFVGGGNLMTDSSFESTDPATPASLWTNAGVTVTKLTVATSFHGSKLLRVTYASGTTPRTDSDLVAKHNVPASSLRSRPMVASVWVWVDTTATTMVGGGTDASLGVFDGTTFTSTPISTLTKGQWNRVSVKFTPAAGATAVNVRLYNPYTNGPVYYDGVQTEFGDAMTAYNPKADEIIYGSITTLELAAGAVKATNVEAGAVTADKISLGQPQVVSIRNGQFSEGNPADGTAIGNGWSLGLGAGATGTIQTDAALVRTARIVNGSLVNSSFSQDITLPVGRHIFRGWVKTTTVVLGTGQGATIYCDAQTGAGTFVLPAKLTGTNAWTLQELVITVTTQGTFRFYGILGFSGTASGTAEFGNLHLIPAVTGTTLTPTAIDAMTITGATFQTAASGSARVAFDSTGFYVADSSATKLVAVTSGGGLNILTPGTVTPADQQKIQWRNGSVVTSELQAYRISGSTASTFLRTMNSAVGEGASFTIRATGSSADDATFQLISSSTAGSSSTSASMNIAGLSRLLLDGTGRSEFLQLATVAARKTNFGSVTVTFPGGGDFSNFATITHSIGAVPTSITLTPVNGRGATTLTGAVDTATPPTSSQATIYLKSTGGGVIAAGSYTCYWMAVG